MSRNKKGYENLRVFKTGEMEDERKISEKEKKKQPKANLKTMDKEALDTRGVWREFVEGEKKRRAGQREKKETFSRT